MLGIVDGFAENRSPRFIVGKNGNAQKPSELTAKSQEAKKVNSFIIANIRGNITRNISPSVIANCDEIQVVNYSTGWSKVWDVYEQLRAFKKDHGDASVKLVLKHLGTNHKPRDNPVDVANKICRLMFHASKEFPKTLIYFSAILPKFGRSFNLIHSLINYVNNEVFILCLDNQKWNIHSTVTLQSTMVTWSNYDFFRKDKIHTSNIGLWQLSKDFISPVRTKNFNILCS